MCGIPALNIVMLQARVRLQKHALKAVPILLPEIYFLKENAVTYSILVSEICRRALTQRA